MARSLIGKIMDLTRSPIPHDSQAFRGSMYGGGSSQNRLTLLNQMGAMGTLYAIVQLISTGGPSTARWHLYRKQQDMRVKYQPNDVGSNIPRKEVLQHSALDLWNKPNDFMTGVDFREVGWQFMELVAEWYWVLNRGPSGTAPPIEIWPVRPDRMDPIPDRDRFLAGWIYTGPSGEKVPLSNDEVIQLRYPDPTDPFRGMSPVQSILADIDAAKYTAEWSRNFFLNSATPGGIVQFSKRLSDEEFDEFTQRWREQHQGVSRGHRVGILEQGAIWVPNTYSLRDMQFTELRTVSREIVREAYRIHASMLGLSEDVNRANAQTAEEVHVAWHEIPRLARVKNVLNEKFLPMFGTTGAGVEFDFDDPTPGNPTEEVNNLKIRSSAAADLVKAGYDPQGVLEAVGLPPIESLPPPAPPAPRPALPPGQPGEPVPPGGQPSEQQIAAWIREGFQGLAADDDPEFGRIANMLISELPRHSNGQRR